MVLLEDGPASVDVPKATLDSYHARRETEATRLIIICIFIGVTQTAMSTIDKFYCEWTKLEPERFPLELGTDTMRSVKFFSPF